MVIFDPALANMQLCPSPSSHCMRTQVTNYLICTVGHCLHLLLSLWFLSVCSSGQSFENSGKKEEMQAFVSSKEDWNDCAGKVGGILQHCLAPDGCHLGPGQDRIKKKTIQNLIFDNSDWIEYGHSPERKSFICASCNDSNNDKIRKHYTVLLQA